MCLLLVVGPFSHSLLEVGDRNSTMCYVSEIRKRWAQVLGDGTTEEATTVPVTPPPQVGVARVHEREVSEKLRRDSLERQQREAEEAVRDRLQHESKRRQQLLQQQQQLQRDNESDSEAAQRRLLDAKRPHTDEGEHDLKRPHHGASTPASLASCAYCPPYYAAPESAAMELIAARPLATLVVGAPVLVANAIPMLFVPEAGVLRGHVARANPLWRLAGDEGIRCLVLFHGPDSYMSPSWYPTKHDEDGGRVVPTWNYALVQVPGMMRAVDDAAWLRAFVTQVNVSASGWRLSGLSDMYLLGRS